VALLGPRQAGKTTLGLEVAKPRPSLYLDLESDSDRAKLAAPELYLAQHGEKLVILEEIQRTPHVFRASAASSTKAGAAGAAGAGGAFPR
jgi:predicted AAA+ superfamily ATPase